MTKLKKIEIAAIPSPVGLLRLEAEGGEITAIIMDAPGEENLPKSGVLLRLAGELDLYFAGKLSRFTVPYKIDEGATDFQRRVLKAVCDIPYGETATYGDLAAWLGTAPRAIGGAVKRNLLPILIPCHRVVGANSLGGYGGDWDEGRAISQKEVLLKIESQTGYVA